MKQVMLKVLGIAVMLSLWSPSGLATELIIDGGFESPVVGPGGYVSGWQSFFTGQTIDGAWTVVGSSSRVDVVPHDEYMGIVVCLPAEGDQCLDLTGYDNGGANGVEQSIITTVNQRYTLSFYLGDMNNAAYYLPGNASVVVKLNGSVFATVNNDGPSVMSGGYITPNWVRETLEFTATTPTTTIAFINNVPAGVGLNGLDGVSVTAVPEPGTLSLFALGILGFLRRRKT